MRQRLNLSRNFPRNSGLQPTVTKNVISLDFVASQDIFSLSLNLPLYTDWYIIFFMNKILDNKENIFLTIKPFTGNNNGRNISEPDRYKPT